MILINKIRILNNISFLPTKSVIPELKVNVKIA